MTERTSLLLRMTKTQHEALKAAADASGKTMTAILTGYIDDVLVSSNKDALVASSFARASYANSILSSVQVEGVPEDIRNMIQKMSGEDSNAKEV